ncbi:1,4-dihydroxy-2-naphthoate octaprenyltransferase [Pseudomonadota bacterium]
MWWQAIRPKTLGMAISPVVLGSALAWTGDAPVIHLEAPLIIVLCAVAIQAGTNLFNDVADHLNGTDDQMRLGPPRVTALGWALPHQVSSAGLTAFLIALLGGMYLVAIGGWAIYFLGLASLIAGYSYSHGPWPVSRTPLGELVVIAFFGIAAVCGTYYLITGAISDAAILCGVALGLPAGAVLLLNNVRDMQGDARTGRKTLAILVGLERSRMIYAALLVAPYVILAVSVALQQVAIGALVGLITVPLALKAITAFRRTEPSPAMNPLLGQTVRLQGWFALSVAGGMFLPLG